MKELHKKRLQYKNKLMQNIIFKLIKNTAKNLTSII